MRPLIDHSPVTSMPATHQQHATSQDPALDDPPRAAQVPQPQLQPPFLPLHVLHSIIREHFPMGPGQHPVPMGPGHPPVPMGPGHHPVPMGPDQCPVHGVVMNVPWYMQPYSTPAYPFAPPSQHPHLAHGVGIATTQPPLWGYTVPPPIPVPHAIETRNCDNGTSPTNEAQDHGNG